MKYGAQEYRKWKCELESFQYIGDICKTEMINF